MVEANKLISLPDSVGNLQNLYFLALSITTNWHRFTKILVNEVFRLSQPDIVAQKYWNGQPKDLKQPISLPDSIGKLQNLIDLEVYNNQLKSLPSSVGNLQNLIRLLAFNNQLTSLPDSVGNL